MTAVEAGAALRQVRDDAGLGLTEQARRIGVSKPTLWRWENGVGLEMHALVVTVLSPSALPPAGSLDPVPPTNKPTRQHGGAEGTDGPRSIG